MKKTLTSTCLLALLLFFVSCKSSEKKVVDCTVSIGQFCVAFNIPQDYTQIDREFIKDYADNWDLEEHMEGVDNIMQDANRRGALPYSPYCIQLLRNTYNSDVLKEQLLSYNIYVDTTDFLNQIMFFETTYLAANQNYLNQLAEILKSSMSTQFEGVKNVFWQEKIKGSGTLYEYLKVKIKIVFEDDFQFFLTLYNIPLFAQKKSLAIRLLHVDGNKDFESEIKKIQIGVLKK